MNALYRSSILVLIAGFVIISGPASGSTSTTTVNVTIVTLDTNDGFFDVQKTLLNDNQFRTHLTVTQDRSKKDVLGRLRRHGSVTSQVNASLTTGEPIGELTEPSEWPEAAQPFVFQEYETRQMVDAVKRKSKGETNAASIAPSTIRDGHYLRGYVQPGDPATVHADLHAKAINAIRTRKLGQDSVIQEADQEDVEVSFNAELEEGQVLVFSSTDLNRFYRNSRKDGWFDFLSPSNRMGFVLLSLSSDDPALTS